jgi:hypothetical protein
LIAAADNTAAETEKVSNDIYAGEAEYDYDTGKPVTPDDEAKVGAAEDFMRMVWKSSESVAFGRYDKYIIIWYCPAAAKVDDDKEALKNIGIKCTSEGGANQCFN